MLGDTAASPGPDDRRILTEAAAGAAARLGLKNTQLARILGVSPATVSRMRQGTYRLEPERKEWELALLLVRLLRSLDAICAGDERVVRQWMKHYNTDLEAVPMERIEAVAGLVDTLEYLDAQRAVV